MNRCRSAIFRNARYLAQDSRGFIISIELVLIATTLIIGLVVGITSVRDAAISELSDIAGAIQDFNQQYLIDGIDGHSAQTTGSDFIDAADFCDDANDIAGSIDNCIVFFAPSDESGDGGGGGGNDGGGIDGGGNDGGGDDGGGNDGGGNDGGGNDGGGDDGGGNDGGGNDGGGNDGGGNDGGGDDGGGGGDDFGTPANGDLVSDNFQDGNGDAPFNLQVRNTTNSPTGFTAVLDSVPYATIPGLAPGDYTLTTTANPDGTFTHVFTSTVDLAPFQGIAITSQVAPTPPGMGGTSNVDLFVN